MRDLSGLGKQVVRAAVYTRKSSDEGLEQEFNSLDAQYEACAAYVASQRHEGWKLVKTRYDDGGISGGTLERKGLQSLLADVERGLVDMIVVYKIDRLTRSLSDFAKLIDRLDAKQCSFVSVTQSFNTSSSMGRLTLNVLLSFAQFEREVTAERIRDKIAASKKKGMWMGGTVPWGYQVHSDPKVQSLEIHGQNAKDIQKVYDLYEELGCLTKLKQAVDRLWPKRSYSRGRLHNILINPIYIGKVRHKTEVYAGLHEAIITEAQFERVQEQLKARSIIKRGKHPSRGPSAFLVGKVFDETQDRLTPSFTGTLRRKRARYYVSNRLMSRGADPTGWRIPAERLETLLTDIIKQRLTESISRLELAPYLKAYEIESVIDNVTALTLEATLDLIARADISAERLRVMLSADKVGTLIGQSPDTLALDKLTLEEPIKLSRRNVGTKLTWIGYKSEPNHALIRAIVTAHDWVHLIKSGQSVSDIMNAQNIPEGMIWKRIRLAFLSPRLIGAILDGTTGHDLTIKTLTTIDVPLLWAEQEARFIR